MHLISRIAVEGFWDTHDFKFDMNEDVTFFIGQNGTGKTTLINLVAAVLTGDFRTLERTAFKKITITLNKVDGERPPSITVTKKRHDRRSIEFAEYTISTGKNNAKDVKFSFDEQIEAYERRYLVDDRWVDFARRTRQRVGAVLEELVNVNWLSVNRITTTTPARDDRSYETLVDKKLESLSNDLVRYFATLSKRKDDEIKKFQESLFITLLEQHDDFNPFELRNVYRKNLHDYQAVLENIFSELHVSEDVYNRVIANFINTANDVIKKFQARDQKNVKLFINETVFISEFKKIENIVERWLIVQEKINTIFMQKDRFLGICGALFQRKEIMLNAENEFYFISRSGKNLTTGMLSSGEKQLLILLIETLLQREQPTIFIADEPELSLHVVWQEKLIGSLRQLNPNAQIIAATHSPDIVGTLDDRAIDMETLIK